MFASLIKSALLVAGASGLAVAAGVAQSPADWPTAAGGPSSQPATGRNDGGARQAYEAPDVALAGAITEWRALQQTGSVSFDGGARFLLSHAGWPGELAVRRATEHALEIVDPGSARVVEFFRRYPPLTAGGRTRYAFALAAIGERDAATTAARLAWTSGSLAPGDEASLLGSFAGSLTPSDHDLRMDILLWQGALQAATRQMALVSSARRSIFEARLALRTNAPDAAERARLIAPDAAGDAGFIADRAAWFRANGAAGSGYDVLVNRQRLTSLPADAAAWFETLLTNARAAAADHRDAAAYDIARQVDDAYPAGTEVAAAPYVERDRYTDLTWLAARTALLRLGRPADAVPLFVSYAGGSRSPSVRTRGFYWAARAADAAGRRDQAADYYGQAAAYPDLYYGQLASERLGRALPPPAAPALRPVDPVARDGFYRREIVRAAQLLGTAGDWIDQTAFIRQIANDAKSDADHLLATELSRTLGRPDLGVMIGRSALQNGLSDYSTVGFPNVRVPTVSEASWTMIHAIARQESQFDRAAVSHAGARGLMQLMPATARDTATKMGMAYNAGALTSDTDYNIMLGSTYFAHLYGLYASYPLAVAAYNAGPGNVNHWLAANGDPRAGGIDMVDWIETIPIGETRNYVQRVLENAVVYDLMNPTRAHSSKTAPISWYLGRTRLG